MDLVGIYREAPLAMDKPTPSRKLKKPNRTWIRAFQPGAGARYLQIARQITDAVSDGVLRPGDRLPPQRELAQTLGVDLTTVTRAYTEVRQAGLLDAHGAGGSYIAAAAAPGTTVDLSMNIPPLLGSDPTARLFQAGMARVQADLAGGELLSYHVGAGARADRDAAARWLQPALGRIDPARIVICPGAQAAIAAVLLARTQPGDRIVTDALTYPGTLAAARVLQRAVVPVECDDDGMRPDLLEAVCREHTPALIYLTPTIQNPTTITQPAARREALLAVAARHQVPVLEDDPYWLLAGDAPPPLAAHGQGPVYYVSTLSKCLAPGLRTAYLVVPPGEAIEPVLDALRSISLMAPQCLVSIATHAIQSGQAQDLLARIRAELGQRQQHAARILPGRPRAHPHGLHLWLGLPAHLTPYRLIQTAQEHGLGVTGSEVFSLHEAPSDAIRISLGGAADQASLVRALETLAGILDMAPTPRFSAVV